MMDLDRERAAGATNYGATITAVAGTPKTIGDEPLIIDLALPPDPDAHYIVEQVSFLAQLSVRVPASGNAPLTGIFLCPPMTPIESTADLSATALWNMNARGFQLPLNDPFQDIALIGAGPVAAFGMSVQAGYKFTLPNGWSIRAEVVCLPGTATPGPGVNSFGRLWVVAYKEQNKC